MIVLRLLLAAALVGAVPAMAAVPAPQVRIYSLNDLAQPLPKPYSETANADADLAAAKARARKSGKTLLIDLGGNWCADCRLLAGVLVLPEVRAFVARHYEVVAIDVGRFDHNMHIPARYGIARPEGVPALLVVDPRTDRLLNPGHTSALADARYMSPQALADWLASWL